MMINNNSILLKNLKTHKNWPCITIILPLFTNKSRSIENQVYFKNTLQKSIYRLKSEQYLWDKTVIKKLDSLSKTILPFSGSPGIGIFISPKIDEMVRFSFHVTEKVIISKSFEITDLMYEVNNHISFLRLGLYD